MRAIQSEVPDAERISPSLKPNERVPRLLASPTRFFLVLAALFTTHVFIRLIASPVANVDECGQLIFAQRFQWGYGPQPPLYTWLQLVLFQVFGLSILALSLLKNVLLFAIYAFTYATTRGLTGSHLTGLIAAMGLMFIPQIAWESQRDLTHSVLATTMAAATLFIFVRLAQTKARWLYVILGVCFGLGLLSNYSYALLALGLLIAALTVPDYRRTILTPWLLLSLAIAVALVLPHALWARDHASVVLASTYKLKIQTSVSWLSTWLAPFPSLAIAWFSRVISITLVFLLL
ncbi:MAG TPA: glycosyltransferase family 39 protein, partial [Candidatus Limnocylindria bacterium]|nr:glycosyltransferase family 39 protein [Candidatus Limnocylindria bacterium]